MEIYPIRTGVRIRVGEGEIVARVHNYDCSFVISLPEHLLLYEL